MPVINFEYQDLLGLIGEERSMEELLDTIPMMGADLHSFDRDEGSIAMEFFPDRPDMYSVEGVARCLRAFLGIEPGIKNYTVTPSDVELTVDGSVKGVRPYMMSAIVTDLEIDDLLIRSMMEMQEKLHMTLGRKRSKVSIGIHDLDRVKAPFRYSGVPPDSISFVPLGMERAMDLSTILEEHPKGVDYAHLVNWSDLYPILTDADGEVLSFPPIINGVLTTVTEDTRNVFIDVTGPDEEAVRGVLNIVVCALAERGGRIHSVLVHNEGDQVTPDLTPNEWALSADEVLSFVGKDMDGDTIIRSLARMGFETRIDNGVFTVKSHATRLDLLHNVDILEDVAIGYGYDRFGETPLDVPGFGSTMRLTKASDMARDVMVGLGYMEVTTLVLSCESEQFGDMCLPEDDVVTVENPITEEHTCLRRSVVPSLLNVLRRNKHRDLPQRIFEVGDVVVQGIRSRKLAGASIHAKAAFTECKSIVESILRETGADATIVTGDSPSFLPGRCATVLIDGVAVGEFGELSPETIVNNDLGYPVVTFELDLEAIVGDRIEGII